MAAHIGHRVDRGRAADDLAARAFDARGRPPPPRARRNTSSRAALLRMRPQPSGMWISGSRSQPPASSTRTRASGVFAEAVGERAAGRTRADDHIGVRFGRHARLAALIRETAAADAPPPIRAGSPAGCRPGGCRARPPCARISSRRRLARPGRHSGRRRKIVMSPSCIVRTTRKFASMSRAPAVSPTIRNDETRWR